MRAGKKTPRTAAPMATRTGRNLTVKGHDEGSDQDQLESRKVVCAGVRIGGPLGSGLDSFFSDIVVDFWLESILSSRSAYLAIMVLPFYHCYNLGALRNSIMES